MKRIAALPLSLVLAACISSTEIQTPAPTDMLAEIQARGTLVIATDADYRPQSHLIEGSSQQKGTKCEASQYSANQFEGFDVDLAVEIARQLGVEPCFVTPPWSQLVAGNWGNNWDIHVGSVAITFDRMEDLYFTTPYYATATVLLIHQDNTTFRTAEDLSGKRIGTCVACTFEAYLNETLKIPGQDVTYRVHDAEVVAYENEDPAIDALSQGDGVQLDAVMTIQPKAYAAINAGYPVKVLGDPLIFSYASVTLDRLSARSNFRLWESINHTIQELHASGRLASMSIHYQGADLTQPAASFDIKSLNQFP